MSKINARSFSNENDDGAPDIVGVSTFSSTAYFVPTKGTTAQRPSDHVEVGSLRFNTDTSNLEYYRGKGICWSQFVLQEPAAIGTRGVFALGYTGSAYINSIDFITISTAGNAADFGDLTVAKGFIAAAGSKTRGIFGGGKTNPANATTNTISFITIATTGNASEFGDMINSKAFGSGLSDCHGGLE